MSEKIIAIDLGGTSAKMGIMSPEGEVLNKWTIRTRLDDQGSHIVPDIIQSIEEQIDLLQLDLSEFIGIGMGTPGTIDFEEQTVIGAYNLNWKTHQYIGKAFNEAFDLPFYIDNDANVAALGEQWQGAGDNENDVIMVTLGTGVGGGIVVGGQLVHGSSGSAGEIGHIVVQTGDDAIACTCGKAGCLEMVASATGILNLARKYSKTYVGDSEIKQRIDDGGALTSEHIFKAAEAGDFFAVEIVDKFSEYLGIALSHLANILNPARIVIGGGVSQAGEFLLNQVEEYCDKHTFPQIKDATQIVLATLGNDAGLIGAGHLVTLASENKMI